MAPVQSPPSRKEESPKTGSEADKTTAQGRGSARSSPAAAEIFCSATAGVDGDLLSPPIARRLRSSYLRTPSKGKEDTLKNIPVDSSSKSERASASSSSSAAEKNSTEADMERECDKNDGQKDGKKSTGKKKDVNESGDKGTDKNDEGNEKGGGKDKDNTMDKKEDEDKGEDIKAVEESDMEDKDKNVKKNDDSVDVGEKDEQAKGELLKNSVERPITRNLRASVRKGAGTFPDMTPKTHKLKTPESCKKPHDGRERSVKRVLNMGTEEPASVNATKEPSETLAKTLEKFNEERQSPQQIMEIETMPSRTGIVEKFTSPPKDEDNRKENIPITITKPDLSGAEKLKIMSKPDLPATERPRTSGGIIVMTGRGCTPEESKATVVAKFLEPLLSKREGKDESKEPVRPLGMPPQLSVEKKDNAPSKENNTDTAVQQPWKRMSLEETAPSGGKEIPVEETAPSGGKRMSVEETASEMKKGAGKQEGSVSDKNKILAAVEESSQDTTSGSKVEEKNESGEFPLKYDPAIPISIKRKQQMRTEQQMSLNKSSSSESDVCTSKDKSTGSEVESDLEINLGAVVAEITEVIQHVSGTSEANVHALLRRLSEDEVEVFEMSQCAASSASRSLTPNTANRVNAQVSSVSTVSSSESGGEGKKLSKSAKKRLKKRLSQLSSAGASPVGVEAVAKDTSQTVASSPKNLIQSTPTTEKDIPQPKASSMKMNSPQSTQTASKNVVRVCESSCDESPLSKRARLRLKRKMKEMENSNGEPASKTPRTEENLVTSPLANSAKKTGTPSLKQKGNREGSDGERETKKTQPLNQRKQISATSSAAVKEMIDSSNLSTVSENLRLSSEESDGSLESESESEKVVESGLQKKKKRALTSSAKRRRRKYRERQEFGLKKSPQGEEEKAVRLERTPAKKTKLKKAVSPTSPKRAHPKGREAPGPSTALDSFSGIQVAEKHLKTQKSSLEESTATPESPPEELISAFSMCILGAERVERSRGAAQKKEQSVQTLQSEAPLCCKCKFPVIEKDELQSGIKARSMKAVAASTQQEGVMSPWEVCSGMEEKGKEKSTKMSVCGPSGKWVVRDFTTDHSVPLKRSLYVNEAEPSKQKKRRGGVNLGSTGAKHRTSADQLKGKEEVKETLIKESASPEQCDSRSDESGKKPMVAVKPMARPPAEISLNTTATGSENESESDDAELVGGIIAARDRLSRALTDLFLSAVQNSDDDDDSDGEWRNMTLLLSEDEPLSPLRRERQGEAQEEGSHTHATEESRNEEFIVESDFADTEEEDDISDLLSSLDEDEDEEDEEESDEEDISPGILLGETLSSGEEDDDWMSDTSTVELTSSDDWTSEDSNFDEDVSAEEDIDNISMKALPGDIEYQEVGVWAGSFMQETSALARTGDSFDNGGGDENSKVDDEPSYISALLSDIKSEDEEGDDERMEENETIDLNSSTDDEECSYNNRERTIDLVEESDEAMEDNLPNRTILLDTTRDDKSQEGEEAAEGERLSRKVNEEENTQDEKNGKANECEKIEVVENKEKSRKTGKKKEKGNKPAREDQIIKEEKVKEMKCETKKAKEAAEHFMAETKERRRKGDDKTRKEKERIKGKEKNKGGKFIVTDLAEKEKSDKERKKRKDENVESKSGVKDGETGKQKTGQIVVTKLTAKPEKRKAETGEVPESEERTKKKRKREQAEAEMRQSQQDGSTGIHVLPPTKSVVFKNLSTESNEQVRAFIEAMLPAHQVQSFSVHSLKEVSIAFVDGAHKEALKLNGMCYKGRKLNARLEKYPPTVASLGQNGDFPKIWSYEKWGSKRTKSKAALATTTASAAQVDSQDKKYNVCIDGVPKTIPRAKVQTEVQRLLSPCAGVGCINIYNRPHSSFYTVIVDIWGIDSYKKALHVNQPCVEAHHVAIIPIKLKGNANTSEAEAKAMTSPASPVSASGACLPSQKPKKKNKKNKIPSRGPFIAF